MSKQKVMKTNKVIAYSAMMAALVGVFTCLSVPLPGGYGYVHAGDGMIFAAAFLLPLPFASVACGIGSALADLALGYAHYAPFTLIIKAGMALITALFIKRWNKVLPQTLIYALASVFMNVAYFFVNWGFYGYENAAGVFFLGFIQSAAGIVIGVTLVTFIKRVPFLYNMSLTVSGEASAIKDEQTEEKFTKGGGDLK